MLSLLQGDIQNETEKKYLLYTHSGGFVAIVKDLKWNSIF